MTNNENKCESEVCALLQQSGYKTIRISQDSNIDKKCLQFIDSNDSEKIHGQIIDELTCCENIRHQGIVQWTVYYSFSEDLNLFQWTCLGSFFLFELYFIVNKMGIWRQINQAFLFFLKKCQETGFWHHACKNNQHFQLR